MHINGTLYSYNLFYCEGDHIRDLILLLWNGISIFGIKYKFASFWPSRNLKLSNTPLFTDFRFKKYGIGYCKTKEDDSDLATVTDCNTKTGRDRSLLFLLLLIFMTYFNR